jgi:Leucine-rich repeat (LRR) protein
MTSNAPGRSSTMLAVTTGSGGAKPSGTQKPRCVIRKITTAVKLNNNLLESVTGLPEALETCMSSPLVTLQWLDLSFNQLQGIEPILLRFLSLKALYLHGNCIRTLPSVERLKKLPKLLILTLNGNPIESSKIYRPYIIGSLPGLRALDHATITDDETQSAISWFKGHNQRAKERAERLRDEGLAMME